MGHMNIIKGMNKKGGYTGKLDKLNNKSNV